MQATQSVNGGMTFVVNMAQERAHVQANMIDDGRKDQTNSIPSSKQSKLIDNYLFLPKLMFIDVIVQICL